MVTLIIGIIASIVIAYLVNYLGDLLPLNQKLGSPICAHCQKTLPWKGFLFYQKCKQCGKHRPARHWLVLAFMLLISILLWLIPFGRLNYWVSLVLLGYFLLVTVIDLEHRLIIISLSIVGAIGCIPVGMLLRMNNPKAPLGLGQAALFTILGGIAGFLIMLGIYYLGVLFNRLASRTRKAEITEEALGYGDVYVAGLIGLLLGWPGIIAILIVAILLGGLFSGGYLIWKKIKKQFVAFSAIPYAPFLIISALSFIYLIK